MTDESSSCDDVSRSPRRLMEDDDAVGRLLRVEHNRAMGPGAPLADLVSRRKRRQHRNLALGTLAALLPLGLIVGLDLHPDRIDILAERLERVAPTLEAQQGPERHEPAPGARSDTASSRPSIQNRAPRLESRNSEGAAATSRESSAARTPQEIAQRQVGESAPAVSAVARKAPQSRAPTSSDALGETVAGCGALSRKGDQRQALRCYAKKAQGQGTSAELSYLEGARIAWRALGASKDALEMLDVYARRFPDGALKKEAALLRVEVLRSTGRDREAREAMDRAAELVPERALEMRKKAYELALSANECQAAKKYAALLVEGGLPETAFTSRLAHCERLHGDSSD